MEEPTRADVPTATWAEFKADLRSSLKAWRVAPLLPLISVPLCSTSYLPGQWWWLGLPLLVFMVGWVGTERIWYLRIYRGEAISARELWRMTWAFFGRFATLGLIAGIAWAPVVIAAASQAADAGKTEAASSTPALWVASALGAVLIDFALTFVTPALAFSTYRVGVALRLGFRMLRAHWPRTAWYALVPPLAIVMMLRVADPSSSSLAFGLAASAASGLLNLWFKGATAAFYLRRTDVGNDGAAFPARTEASEIAAAYRL